MQLPFAPRSALNHGLTRICTGGRGFIILKNETALPEMPSLHQEIPEQHAMIAAFHQIHCVVSQTPWGSAANPLTKGFPSQWASKNSFFKALNGTSDADDLLHMSHCWDYLRQAIMCHADTTLEWMPNSGQHVSKGWGYEHRCRDWDALYHWSGVNRWGDGHGIH